MKINKHSKSNKTENLTSQLSASLLMQRLPIHRQLGRSIAFLNKCEPVWQQWLAGQSTLNLGLNHKTKPSLNRPTMNQPSISLSHFQNGELIIHCRNSILATQIKQQQTNLLQFLHANGLVEVERFSIRIAEQRGTSKALKSSLGDDKTQEYGDDAKTIQTKRSLNDTALNSIKVAQKTTSSNALADVLNRLVKTIERNKG